MKNFLLLLTLFSLNFNTLSQPVNNTCSNAQTITLPEFGERVCVNGTTVGASSSFGNQWWICSGNGQDVWYKFTTGFDVEFSVDFIRGTIGNGVEINFFSQCPPGGYLGFVGCYSSNFSFMMTLQPNTTYYMLVYNGKQGSNTGQGTFQLCIENNVILLPVTLTSFTTECNGGIPLLKWVTASEQNSDYFQLERSRDGINWVEVSKIQAMGNSNTEKKYEFYDISSGGNFEGYYRLKQVDFDGKFEYFNPIYVKCDEQINVLEKVDIFPNPIDNELYVSFKSNLIGFGSLMICDYSGRTVEKTDIILDNYNLFNVQMTDYVKGVYFLKIKTDNYESVHKIVKN
jgi:hypothetical protein